MESPARCWDLPPPGEVTGISLSGLSHTTGECHDESGVIYAGISLQWFIKPQTSIQIWHLILSLLFMSLFSDSYSWHKLSLQKGEKNQLFVTAKLRDYGEEH